MAWTEKYANFDLTTGDNDGSSEANAWQTTSAMTTGLGTTVNVPTRVNIKRQAVGYNLTESQTWSPSGTALCPLWYRGYTTTPGDGGLWEVRCNTISVASLMISGEYCTVEGVAFLPGATTNASGLTAAGFFSTMTRCQLYCAQEYPSTWNLIDCDISLSRTNFRAAGATVGPCLMYGNRFTLLDSIGVTELALVDCYGRNVAIVNNLFVGNGASGVRGISINRANESRVVQIIGNTFYNIGTGLKIDEEPDAVGERVLVMGNVFDTMAAYGIERTNTEAGFLTILKNYYRACTSGFTNYTEASPLTNTAFTASPFVDAANGDFRLNETAGGGGVLRAAGFPVNYPYDWDNMIDQAVYEGPSPADIAAAVWARTGRTLTP